MATKPNPAEALEIFARAHLQSFDPSDWSCYSGAETENPMISCQEDWTVVLDGNRLELYSPDEEKPYVYTVTLTEVAL